MRAAQRRNYFRKVLEEIQHRLELDQKMQKVHTPNNLDISREDASISDDLFPDHILQVDSVSDQPQSSIISGTDQDQLSAIHERHKDIVKTISDHQLDKLLKRNIMQQIKR